jgi:hypothetical protein
VKRFRQEIPGFDRRHAVTPGLTGIAQIYGHSELPRRQKLRYDLLYIKRQSFWLDVKLVLVSFFVTFTGKWEVRSKKVPRWAEGRRSRPNHESSPDLPSDAVSLHSPATGKSHRELRSLPR